MKERKRGMKRCALDADFQKFVFNITLWRNIMKTALKEISRNIKKELACVNMTVTIIAMVLSVVTGVFFAIGGIDGEAWEEICTPVWALHPVILVIFFALALCLLAISLSITFFSPLHLCGKPMQTAYILYACVYALTYIWIPLTYKATAFFASALTCAVCLVLLSVLYPLVRRVGKLPSLCLLLFSAWQGYLLCFSFALFVVN